MESKTLLRQARVCMSVAWAGVVAARPQSALLSGILPLSAGEPVRRTSFLLSLLGSFLALAQPPAWSMRLGFQTTSCPVLMPSYRHDFLSWINLF